MTATTGEVIDSQTNDSVDETARKAQGDSARDGNHCSSLSTIAVKQNELE